MGRPRRDRLHRRPHPGRRARPQRPASRALLRDPRRPLPALLGGGHHRGRPRERADQRLPGTRRDARGRHAGGPRALQRPAARPDGQAQAVPRLDRRGDPHPGRPRPRAARTRTRAGRPDGGRGRDASGARHQARHPLGRRGRGRASHGDHGQGADRLHGHRRTARLPLQQDALVLRLLLPALRPGHQPAHRRAARGPRHLYRALPGKPRQPT